MNATVFFNGWLRGSFASQYESARKSYEASHPYALKPAGRDGATANVSAVFRRAREIAEETGGGRTIHARHLLAALLTYRSARGRPNAQERLEDMGIDLLALRRDFQGHLRRHASKDDQVAWQRILLAEEKRSDRAPSAARIAGVAADDAAKQDLLGIAKDVEALCSVLAAKDLQPPLSVGLFGDWGTGKSSFMLQMQDRIDELQRDARENHDDSDYCESIVQLKFNAWHYIDTNLWANLTSTIFEGLAATLAKGWGKDSTELARARVLAAAATASDALAEAERKKSRAEAQLRQSEECLKKLREDEAGLEASLTPQELFRQAYRFAIGRAEVQESAAKAAQALHISNAEAAATDVTTQLLELGGIGHAVWLAIRKTKDLWIWLLLGAAALLVSRVAIPQLVSLATKYKVPAYVDSLAAALFGMITFLSPFLSRARSAFRFIKEAERSKQDLIVARRAEREAELRAQEQQIKLKAEQATREVDEARKAVNDLDNQLQQLRADRQMADYIVQRKESTDYTQHLGVIARARNDFTHLATLLGAVKKEAEEELRKRTEQTEQKRKDEGKPPLIPRIERIILYIDDLDRCPEKYVVDVLQAVHLLLAFPLFVVVVGVDSRWLLHSLRQHSKVFQDAVATHESYDEERLHWESTPLNYLEKIFQIPFNLSAMTREGFDGLVDDLAKQPEDGKKTSARSTPKVEELTARGTTADAGDAGHGVSTSTDLFGTPPAPAAQAVERTTAVTPSPLMQGPTPTPTAPLPGQPPLSRHPRKRSIGIQATCASRSGSVSP